MGRSMCSLTYTELEPDTIARLRRIGPFSVLRPDEMSSLLAGARSAIANPGTILPMSGPTGPVMYVIVDGSVCLVRDLPGGQRCLVEISDAPCLIGEVALFDDRSLAVAAEVLHRVILVELPANAVLRCLRGNPVAQLRMLGYMSARLKRLIVQIANLKLMTGPQRLAHFLTALSERRAGAKAAGSIRLPFEKQTLAALLGMTPESLSRSFRRLDQLGVRNLPGGEVRIADVEVLRHFVEPEVIN